MIGSDRPVPLTPNEKERLVPSFSTPLEQAIHAALALANARRHEFATLEHLLLALLDIDHFKRINDIVGVSGGDLLIVEVAKRIAQQLDLRDSIARVGGDDFVILLDEMSPNLRAFSNTVTTVAAKVLSIFDERFKVADSWFRVTARVGISLFGREHVVPEKLINQAESAMYRAKDVGERMVFFDSAVQEAQVVVQAVRAEVLVVQVAAPASLLKSLTTIVSQGHLPTIV